MKKIKVTQIRSVIKRNETQKRTIQALGLGKINRFRIHDDSPSIRGMINTVKHLVSVSEVETEPERKKPEATAPKASPAKKAEEKKESRSKTKTVEEANSEQIIDEQSGDTQTDEETPENTDEKQ